MRPHVLHLLTVYLLHHHHPTPTTRYAATAQQACMAGKGYIFLP